MMEETKGLCYALFRSNIDWASEARNCGDPKCDGNCRYIATVRRYVRDYDGGILPDRDGSKAWAEIEELEARLMGLLR